MTSMLPGRSAVGEPTRFEPPKLTVTPGLGLPGRSSVGLGALADAREEGRRAALAEVDALIEEHRCARADAERAGRTLQSAVQQLRAFDAETLAEVQEQVVALAVALAESIVGREVRSFDDVARAAVDRALALAPDRGPAVMRVDPADVGAVTAWVEDGRRTGDVSVVADPTVGRGGCTVEVGALLVDATIEAAIARLRATFDI